MQRKSKMETWPNGASIAGGLFGAVYGYKSSTPITNNIDKTNPKIPYKAIRNSVRFTYGAAGYFVGAIFAGSLGLAAGILADHLARKNEDTNFRSPPIG